MLNAPLDGRVFHIKAGAADIPHFRFEWHPGARTVYLIRLLGNPPIGEPFAFEIDNEGAAINATLIFLRGYRAAGITKGEAKCTIARA